MHILVLSSVEIIEQPGVDGTEHKSTCVISSPDLWDVAEQPGKLQSRWVSGEGQPAYILELVGTFPCLELADDGLCPGVGPGNGVVQGLAGLTVPQDGCFPLAGDANGFDIVGRVAHVGKGLGCFFDTGIDRLYNLARVLFHPSAGRVNTEGAGREMMGGGKARTPNGGTSV